MLTFLHILLLFCPWQPFCIPLLRPDPLPSNRGSALRLIYHRHECFHFSTQPVRRRRRRHVGRMTGQVAGTGRAKGCSVLRSFASVRILVTGLTERANGILVSIGLLAPIHCAHRR
uniref:Putative secreted protein n=1 Tax=Anopheles marajoara TaxID=58244 RepID=A0A2M4C7L0_9DIPT